MTSSSETRRQSALLRDSLAAATPASFSADLRGTVHGPGGTRPGTRARGSAGIDAARADAWEAGHTAGYQAGLLEAAQEHAAWGSAVAEDDRRERAERAAQWASLLGSLEVAVERAVRSVSVTDLHTTAAHMAVEIAEALVGHHLRVADCSARDAVERALAEAPRGVGLTVRLNPDDAALAGESLADLAPGSTVVVVADPAIEVGGCVVDAGDRTIDARLDAALERVREVLAQ